MAKASLRYRVPAGVARFVAGLHPDLKKKLRSALERVARDPGAGKALQGELAGLCSLRVARFRIIYRPPAHGSIDIVAIGPRDRIYEETLRLVSRERAQDKPGT